MSFLEELKKSIPERFHSEPDFKALIDIARLNNFNSKEELLDHLEREIKQIEDWLKNNQDTGGTIVKDLRDKSIKLGTCKACIRYIEEYL